ncbi:hypothetical protein KOW79_022198 [Hemibagrus wyckioides]|uniref:Uncharacterized protein n=1 Tax=Hemibagrus wyckioides TaxID=337641 RepID=A0A9D3N5J0_9TELE|nr:hypothetical protein KOW79_022198 [Hemibagrus wyckioides]
MLRVQGLKGQRCYSDGVFVRWQQQPPSSCYFGRLSARVRTEPELVYTPVIRDRSGEVARLVPGRDEETERRITVIIRSPTSAYIWQENSRMLPAEARGGASGGRPLAMRDAPHVSDSRCVL